MTKNQLFRPCGRGLDAENLCAGGFPAAVHRQSNVRGHAEGGGIKIVSQTETGTRRLKGSFGLAKVMLTSATT